MKGSINSKQNDNSLSQQKMSTDSPARDRDQYKRVQQNLLMMNNRVQLLRQQLKKQKDGLERHKNLTEQVVKKKIQYSKINAFKNKDSVQIESQISQLRQRNHTYREMHKNEMNNILKAVYLVKLDDARQIKNASMENRRSLQKLNQSYEEQRREKKREMASQSEKAKQKYMEYWKNKLNSIYTSEMQNQQYLQRESQEKKNRLKQLQEEELQLLEQINRMHSRQMEAKKQYVAAMTLSNKQISEAVKSNNESKDKQKKSIQMVSSKSESIRYKQTQFFTKSPFVSLMSSNDLKIPRTRIDQNKFQIILKQLKRLDKKDGDGSNASR